jgi:hypothetical protein
LVRRLQLTKASFSFGTRHELLVLATAAPAAPHCRPADFPPRVWTTASQSPELWPTVFSWPDGKGERSHLSRIRWGVGEVPYPSGWWWCGLSTSRLRTTNTFSASRASVVGGVSVSRPGGEICCVYIWHIRPNVNPAYMGVLDPRPRFQGWTSDGALAVTSLPVTAGCAPEAGSLTEHVFYLFSGLRGRVRIGQSARRQQQPSSLNDTSRKANSSRENILTTCMQDVVGR